MGKTTIRKAQGGVPKGGTTNDALIKNSPADYDDSFQAQSGGGGSGGGTKLYVTTTPTNASAAAETTILTTTIPGGILGVNNVVKTFFKFNFQDGNSVNFTLRFKYGGTTMLTLVTSCGNTGGDRQGHFEYELISDGATNAQKVNGRLFNNLNGGTTILFKENLSVGTAAVDSTLGQTLEITCELSAALNTFVMQNAIVEVVSSSGVGSSAATTGGVFQGTVPIGGVTAAETITHNLGQIPKTITLKAVGLWTGGGGGASVSEGVATIDAVGTILTQASVTYPRSNIPAGNSPENLDATHIMQVGVNGTLFGFLLANVTATTFDILIVNTIFYNGLPKYVYTVST